LVTWTSMHLGCQKRKKMNEKRLGLLLFDITFIISSSSFYLYLLHHFDVLDDFKMLCFVS
jgi:hypothetical protein